MKRTYGSVVPLALLLALTACGDDDPTGITGDDLTENEAAALAEVVAGTLFETFAQNQGPQPSPAQVTGSVSLDVNVPCDLSGSVAVAGNLAFDLDDETGEGTLNYTVTQTHQNCMGESDGGILFTVNGSPNITAALLVTLTDTSLSLAGDYGGGVSWATGDKSGTCTVDVDFTASLDVTGESGSATIAGTVCGVNFSQNLTFVD